MYIAKGKSLKITEEEKSSETDIPEWQKEIVLKRRAHYANNHDQLTSWEEAKKILAYETLTL